MDCLVWKCLVCLDPYSEVRVPRSLQCGHSLCTLCVKKCLEGNRCCPECNELQHVDDISNLVINYSVLRFLRTFEEEGGSIEDYNPKESETASYLGGDIKQDTSDIDWYCDAHGGKISFLCCTCSKWVCQDCLVIDHAFLPRGNCRIVNLSDALVEMRVQCVNLINFSMKIMENLRTGTSEEYDICQNLLEYCPLNSKIHTRATTLSKSQLEEALNEKDLSLNHEIERLEKLAAAGNNINSAKEMSQLCSTLIERQQEHKKIPAKEKERTDAVISVILSHWKADLKSLAQEKQPLFAVLKKNNGTCWSPIVIKDDRLLLYSLCDRCPPDNALVIPYEYVKKLVPIKDANTFFELSTSAGESLGRIHIHLTEDGSFTSQFIMMCSGEMGSTYKGTRIYKTRPTYIGGGDYENNDGTGGTPLIETDGFHRLTGSRYTKKNPILVADKISTNFCIYLASQRGDHSQGMIGEVTKGLDILKRILYSSPQMDVVISDCGISITMKNKERNS